MKKSLLVLSISLIIISGCGSQSTGSNGQPTPPDTLHYEPNKPIEVEQPLTTTDLGGFSFELFRTVFEEEGDLQNTLISPYSVQMALLLLANGIDESNRELIMDTLYLSETDLDEENERMQELLEIFKGYEEAEIKTANSLWHKDKLTVLEEYEELISTFYNSEIHLMPDIQPEDEINEWVSEKTNGLIPRMLDEVDPKVVAYLMNAVYFNANWQNAFKENLTTEETFHLLNGETIEHPMMKQTEKFPLIEGDSFRAIKIPYEQEGLYMAVVLPDEGEFENVGSNLEDAFNVEKWMHAKVELQMPAFSFSANYSLAPKLTELGLGPLFQGKVGLPNMFNEHEPYEINRVIHKTFIDVDEKGTEAAAATGIEITVESAEIIEIEPFIVDRPFFFAIMDDTTESVLFMGSVIEPMLKEE
ncbi:serpin family protein [Alkalicoccobacillus porphyridii]|uniref:serpin family protein n=1 Tax=Alkalicoccobacillus porphyridii TaxID=2597270 RepID=UPI00163D7CFA|nr:serpin family protein [Alkalicoccobacillus porphyridii]